MGKLPDIRQHPCKTQCGWSHPNGKTYSDKSVLPSGVCPFLYHSIYPYFLGLLYGAKEMQDIWACCPAEKSVNVLIRKKTNGWPWGSVPKWLIYAEIVNDTDCPHGHKKGDCITFPTYCKPEYLCPAGFNNLFYFLDLEIPECINKKKIRCPDWKEDVFYEVKDG